MGLANPAHVPSLQALNVIGTESRLQVLDILCVLGTQIQPGSNNFYAPKVRMVCPLTKYCLA